jgi:hypothetical protein
MKIGSGHRPEPAPQQATGNDQLRGGSGERALHACGQALSFQGSHTDFIESTHELGKHNRLCLSSSNAVANDSPGAAAESAAFVEEQHC